MSHLGIVKSKQLMRNILFWPGASKQIEDKVTRCPICQMYHNKPHAEPLINHHIKDVGIDLFEYQGEHYLVIVDYYSKYPEVVRMHSTSSIEVINQLKQIFGKHGIPQIVVSDNGP